jgi:hypothetical protein
MEDMHMTNETSQLPNALPSWLPEARHQLASLGLPPEWPEETVEAPSSRASKSADCTLRLLAEHGLAPTWMLPSLEGGVCLAFTAGSRYADIQFLNNGEIVTTCAQGAKSVSQTLPSGSDLGAVLRTIRTFLNDGR